MIKDKFFKTTLILVIGGFITKALGFIIKIIYTRLIGNEGISIYMLVMPTYSLLITLATLSLPIAISKLVSEGQNSKKIIFSIIPVILLLNILVIFIVTITAPYIANNLLHEPLTEKLLISLTYVLPFISISSIIRGYFFGKQKMMPHTMSNIIEQIAKLILVLIIIPPLIKIDVLLGVNTLILLSILSETVSIIVFLLYLPKNFSIKKNELKPDLYSIKEIFKISIPSVSSRLIGNIGYFLEPIILTTILISIGYDKSFVINEYAYYNAYAIPTLLVPAFFISAISTSLIPEISKYHILNKYNMIKRRLKQTIAISILIGLSCNLFIFIFAKNILQIVYHTTKGINYLKILCPFFIIFYLEAPFVSILQGLGKTKITLTTTLIGQIIKVIIIVFFSYLRIGIYGLIIAEIINILIVVLLNLRHILHTLH